MMTKFQSSHTYILFLLASVLVTFLDSTYVLEENTMRKAVVEFDPYVSTLDRANKSRYAIADLEVLIAKVATRFSRIYIELTKDDLKLGDQLEQTSRFLSPVAAAKYNALVNSNGKVEVWLGLNHDVFENLSITGEKLKKLYSLVILTNESHKETLTTLLIPQSIFIGENNTKLIPEMKRFLQEISLERGLLIDPPFTCEKKVISEFQPNIIILRQNSYFQYAYVKQQELEKCKVVVENIKNSTIFGAVHHVPDTGTDNIVNTSNLVSTWIQAIKWANSSGNTVILSTAFDLPNKIETPNKTTGWWRLIENSSYDSVNDFIFEDKYFVAKEIDWEENPKNFQWLQSPTNFSANSSGMLFQEDDLSKQNLKSLILKELLGSNITRTLILDKKFPKQGSIMKYSELDDNATNFINFTLLHRYSKSNLEENITKNVGLYLSRSLCDSYAQMEKNSKQKLLDTLGNANYIIFVFYYIEKAEIVKLGARRMFQQRIVKLDLCRKMVLESGNTKTQIGYTLLEYPDLSVSDQESPWELQNIVKYYKLLNDWANLQTKVTIFLPAIDRMKSGSNSKMLGWWRINSKRNEVNFIDKQSDALKLSKSHFEKDADTNESSANHTRIILIATTSIATIITLATLSIFCVKRHSREKSELSKGVLDSFYNGTDSEEILETDYYTRVPYDKQRYEIDESNFSIDSSSSAALGTGEFGKVVRGKIYRSGNTVDVAIKMTNPNSSHNCALKGLLSEIKLLTYIGKHENITELIGANTKNLKRGKCFIILELCHLGSLQKYLREIRIPTNNLVVNYSHEYVNLNEEYSNVQINSSATQLDAELSADLYRWSIEICGAMVYLSEKHVVHADLATRNVLLNLRKTAKICDFGLSRRMYNYTDYVKTNQEPLPWKWMAPESLRFMTFSEKSDVWSFGITLWEIYSLGETPYQGMSWDVNFAQMLERGLRLSEPRFNEHNMFEIMESCWTISADQRPMFSAIFNLLTTDSTN